MTRNYTDLREQQRRRRRDMTLEEILTNLKDAGCNTAELKKAETLFRAGDEAELMRFFRKCRCSRMEELHLSQRNVDRMDYLIRQSERGITF